MAKRTDWEEIKPLGKGGQSEVLLVRSPERVAEREKCLQKLMELAGQGFNSNRARDFAKATLDYAREEHPSELGALKIFNPRAAGPEAEQQALDRLRSEIAVLKQNRHGLLKLLDSNEAERWIVTEYCPRGTLEDYLPTFKGKAPLALGAFRSLVEAVASLHKDNIVHRDIKPANVFVGNSGQLILGDFGIVFLPDQPERLTTTMERVGPRDYMPQWADLGERLEKVDTNFDVYMLGKILWCMVAGRLRLPREYYKRSGFNVTELFPNDPDMHIVNRILDKCLVEEPDQCLPAAQELLMVVNASLDMIRRGGQVIAEGVPQPCRVCGVGFYNAVTLPVGATGQSTVGLSMAGMPIERLSQ